MWEIRKYLLFFMQMNTKNIKVRVLINVTGTLSQINFKKKKLRWEKAAVTSNGKNYEE